MAPSKNVTTIIAERLRALSRKPKGVDSRLDPRVNSGFNGTMNRQRWQQAWVLTSLALLSCAPLFFSQGGGLPGPHHYQLIEGSTLATGPWREASPIVPGHVYIDLPTSADSSMALYQLLQWGSKMEVLLRRLTISPRPGDDVINASENL